jgi:DUF2934 family protein
MPSKQDKPATKVKRSPSKATKPRLRRRRAPSHDDIAMRAYELYLAEGGGDELSHWLRAEQELVAA